jgi:hypothetical protein
VQIIDVTPEKKVVLGTRAVGQSEPRSGIFHSLLDEHGAPENGDLESKKHGPARQVPVETGPASWMLAAIRK